jgi:hypothetical protein
MVITGRTRQVRGENLVPTEFEIQLELPDKYSRRDEFPAQDQGPVVSGFSGDNVVLIPRPQPPPPGRGPVPTPQQQEMALRARLGVAKQDFARLMLGLFATSFSAFPLTYSYIGQAEAPQGKADVVEVKGPANFTARLFVDAESHLPLLLTWQAAQPPGRGGPPARGGPPPGGAPAGPPPGGPPPGGPAPVEQRMFFADYRDVDGVKFPFRIRRASGAETTEETTFDRFRINAKVDPRRFETDPK